MIKSVVRRIDTLALQSTSNVVHMLINIIQEDIYMKNTEIIKENEVGLKQFDSNQVQVALSTLKKYMNLSQNNNRFFDSGIHLTITDILDDLSLKRSTLIESKVVNAKFTNSALTGSYFSDVKFSDSNFDESNLQYCQFIQSEFSNTIFSSTNLSYSNFYNTIFDHVSFKGSTVSEILFEKCSFRNCSFSSSMMENTIFNDCILETVRFEKTNVEYMELKSCNVKNLYLPISQIPYIFGIVDYLAEEKIKVNTDEKIISISEYIQIQQSLVIYYTSINEYFPLTNIYFSTGDINSAYCSIIEGMKQSIIQRNFRMLKFYCKQAAKGNIFDYNKLRELYQIIEHYVNITEMNIYEQRSFIYNVAEIRSLLIDNIYDLPTARIELQTNIDSVESSKVIQFIEYIDAVTELCTQKISHIEYRHNSEVNFVTYLSAHYEEILLVISTLMIFANNAWDNIQKRILTNQEIQLNKIKIEKEKLELTKVKQQEAEQKGADLSSNNIQYSIKYIINNNVIIGDNDIFL